MRSADDLIDREQSAWPLVQQWARAAKNPVELLPGDATRGRTVLTALQVTTRSPMGALACHSGGLVVDGWLRILGGGGPRMHGDLARWNGIGSDTMFSGVAGACIVALDVVGGVFAVDGRTRLVSYFAPDALAWQPLERGYSDFVQSMLASDLDAFFTGLRWPGWRADVATLALDDGIGIYPPLWSKESRAGTPSRKPAPLRQLVGAALDFARQLTI